MRLPVIAITTGEPAGIGPEIAIRGALDCLDSLQPILIGDYHQLASLAQQMGYGPLMHRLPAEGLSKAGFAPLFGKLVVVDKPLLKLLGLLGCRDRMEEVVKLVIELTQRVKRVLVRALGPAVGEVLVVLQEAIDVAHRVPHFAPELLHGLFKATQVSDAIDRPGLMQERIQAGLHMGRDLPEES